jgi:hypothetical protein
MLFRHRNKVHYPDAAIIPIPRRVPVWEPGFRLALSA